MLLLTSLIATMAKNIVFYKKDDLTMVAYVFVSIVSTPWLKNPFFLKHLFQSLIKDEATRVAFFAGRAAALTINRYHVQKHGQFLINESKNGANNRFLNILLRLL